MDTTMDKTMDSKILDRLQGVISELINCQPEEVAPRTNLVEDLGFESIDFLELGFTIGHIYRMEVDEKALFLADFRPLIHGATPDEALEKLRRAYPHLPPHQLEEMLRDAPGGNVLRVEHLVRYILHHAKNGSRAA